MDQGRSGFGSILACDPTMGCFARASAAMATAAMAAASMMVASFADCRYASRAYCCSENPRSFIVRAIYTIAEKASDLIVKDA